MAKSILNVVMQGASGKIGKTLVFRQTRNGETVIAIRGKKRSTPPTAKEAAVRERFKEAAHTAKILINDPVYGPIYRAMAKKQGKTAYILAMKDCLTAPKIKSVKINGTNRESRGAIGIRAIENVKVASVRVHRIQDAGNTLTQQGLATVKGNNLAQLYVTKPENSSFPGCNVQVTASNIDLQLVYARRRKSPYKSRPTTRNPQLIYPCPQRPLYESRPETYNLQPTSTRLTLSLLPYR